MTFEAYRWCMTAAGAPMQRIFASGMREFLKLRGREGESGQAILDGARRTPRADILENNRGPGLRG